MAASTAKALYRRELKRYFASNIYVMNTLVGYVMMILLAVGVCVAGIEKMDQLLGIPGVMTRALPLLLGVICGISSTTSNSISMEGKQWWLIRSLPVSTGQILDSKLMVNLTVGVPSMLFSVILLILFVPNTLLGNLWLVLTPLAYLFWMSVLGLFINLKMPVFDWESETTVIKQSGATMICLLVGMISGILPMVLLFLLPQQFQNLLMGAVTLGIFGASAALYRINQKADLRKVG